MFNFKEDKIMTKADIDNYLKTKREVEKTERELEERGELIMKLWRPNSEIGGIDRVDFNLKDGEFDIVYRTPALFYGERDGYSTFTCPISYLYMTEAELVAERDRIWARAKKRR